MTTVEPRLVVNAVARMLVQQRVPFDLIDPDAATAAAVALLAALGVGANQPPPGWQSMDRPAEVTRDALKRALVDMEQPLGIPGQRRPRMLR